jgi:hypothetical protein
LKNFFRIYFAHYEMLIFLLLCCRIIIGNRLFIFPNFSCSNKCFLSLLLENDSRNNSCSSANCFILNGYWRYLGKDVSLQFLNNFSSSEHFDISPLEILGVNCCPCVYLNAYLKQLLKMHFLSLSLQLFLNSNIN